MINVLYVCFASKNFDGAIYSLIDMLNSLKGEVNPILLLRSKGCVYDYFTEKGVECIVCDFDDGIIGIPTKWHQYIRYILKYIPRNIKYNRKNSKCLEYVYNQLKDRDIKIVHNNSVGLAIGYKIAKLLGAKHVWHLRGFLDLALGWMPLKGWDSLKRDISESDAQIGIAKVVLDHYMPSNNEKSHVFFDAVRSKDDICLITPKEKYFLFCAGFLSTQKGCEFSIIAFAKSNLAKQGYRLRIIGKSLTEKYDLKIKKLASDYGVLEYIDFIGFTNNVKEQMSKATAFLMCSENEGMGRVSVEAMFYGCLVLGRNSGGTKEFVLDNETGYIFNSTDECALLMQKVASEDNTRIINNAQSFACSNFAIEDYGKRINTVYENILTHK